MTVREALKEAKSLADKCLARDKRFPDSARFECSDGEVSYTEDWPRRYMKASLNGRMYPVIFLHGKLGSRLVLQFARGGWSLAVAMDCGDGELSRAATEARDEWNKEIKEREADR